MVAPPVLWQACPPVRLYGYVVKKYVFVADIATTPWSSCLNFELLPKNGATS